MVEHPLPWIDGLPCVQEANNLQEQQLCSPNIALRRKGIGKSHCVDPGRKSRGIQVLILQQF